MSDSPKIVWDGLAAGGYDPHGQLHDFRARCPGHDGDNRDALHVSVGAGGVVLLWCHAHGCSTEEIVEPIGLRTRDLFPLKLGDSGRRLRTARREDFKGNAKVVANVLLALEQLGEPWGLSLWLGLCPNCEQQHLQLSISSTGEPRVYCGRGCDLGMFSQALADLVRGPKGEGSMTDPLDEVHAARERRQQRFAIKLDGKPPKPQLPDLPAHDDLVGQCDFLTAVLHLDVGCPIIGGRHAGLAGGQGHIALDRLGATALEFKPASRISKGESLAADLVWQLERTDGEPYSWSNHQATKIARVVRLLCDASGAITSRQETSQILTTYIDAAEEVEGNTYGTTNERHEAAVALRPVLDQYGKVQARRFLLDKAKAEIAIRVSDLAQVARAVLGSSIARGWLDAQMGEFGWERVELQGQSISGRAGRVQGLHASCDVYRGSIESVYPNETP